MHRCTMIAHRCREFLLFATLCSFWQMSSHSLLLNRNLLNGMSCSSSLWRSPNGIGLVPLCGICAALQQQRLRCSGSRSSISKPLKLLLVFFGSYALLLSSSSKLSMSSSCGKLSLLLYVCSNLRMQIVVHSLRQLHEPTAQVYTAYGQQCF